MKTPELGLTVSLKGGRQTRAFVLYYARVKRGEDSESDSDDAQFEQMEARMDTKFAHVSEEIQAMGKYRRRWDGEKEALENRKLENTAVPGRLRRPSCYVCLRCGPSGLPLDGDERSVLRLLKIHGEAAFESANHSHGPGFRRSDEQRVPHSDRSGT